MESFWVRSLFDMATELKTKCREQLVRELIRAARAEACVQRRAENRRGD